MRKVVLFGCVLVLVVAGCGGGTTPSSSEIVGGRPSEVYSATLADGSTFTLEILQNDRDGWMGEYDIEKPDGSRDESGAFSGNVDGKPLSATADSILDSSTFDLSGSEGPGATLVLTKSDLPGTTITFKRVGAMVADIRTSTRDAGVVRFTISSGAMSGPATMSLTPVPLGGNLTAYNGIWQATPKDAVPFAFKFWPSSTPVLEIYSNPDNLLSGVFDLQPNNPEQVGKTKAEPLLSACATYRLKSDGRTRLRIPFSATGMSISAP